MCSCTACVRSTTGELGILAICAAWQPISRRTALISSASTRCTPSSPPTPTGPARTALLRDAGSTRFILTSTVCASSTIRLRRRCGSMSPRRRSSLPHYVPLSGWITRRCCLSNCARYLSSSATSVTAMTLLLSLRAKLLPDSLKNKGASCVSMAPLKRWITISMRRRRLCRLVKTALAGWAGRRPTVTLTAPQFLLSPPRTKQISVTTCGCNGCLPTSLTTCVIIAANRA